MNFVNFINIGEKKGRLKQAYKQIPSFVIFRNHFVKVCNWIQSFGNSEHGRNPSWMRCQSITLAPRISTPRVAQWVSGVLMSCLQENCITADPVLGPPLPNTFGFVKKRQSAFSKQFRVDHLIRCYLKVQTTCRLGVPPNVPQVKCLTVFKDTLYLQQFGHLSVPKHLKKYSVLVSGFCAGKPPNCGLPGLELGNPASGPLTKVIKNV